MRLVLRALGTRYGIALVLLVVVLGVVALFRGIAGNEREPTAAPVPPASPRVAGNGTPLDTDNRVEPPSPSIADTTRLEASATALSFTAAWLRHTGVTGAQWRSGLAPYATSGLLDRLAQTDPAVVPADRTDGEVTLIVKDPALLTARIPLDVGILELTLIIVAGHWRVDGISLDRAR